MTIPAFRFNVYCISSFLFVTFAFAAGSETFVQSKKWTPVGPNPCDIVATDLNGDGLSDLVTADRGE
ncbi:MAG: hypothetical protein LUQ59_12175, partial [Methanothrix sp.]|nr:hypothetical protein [Methanothrix sp.]